MIASICTFLFRLFRGAFHASPAFPSWGIGIVYCLLESGHPFFEDRLSKALIQKLLDLGFSRVRWAEGGHGSSSIQKAPLLR